MTKRVCEEFTVRACGTVQLHVEHLGGLVFSDGKFDMLKQGCVLSLNVSFEGITKALRIYPKSKGILLLSVCLIVCHTGEVNVQDSHCLFEHQSIRGLFEKELYKLGQNKTIKNFA